MKIKLKAIHIFLILLASLMLCSILGGKCGQYEGMTSGRTSTSSYIGPAGDVVDIEAPRGKESELSDISSSTRDVMNKGETVVGSLLSNIKSDVGKVKDSIKSLANKTTIEYSSSPSLYMNTSTEVPTSHRQLPAVQHSNITPRKAPITVRKSQIPPGDEDLYILKSQIVPPVCPACPTNTSCPRDKPCPPCPPCARCPEPSFECKKVPNYATNNTQYLPRPVLSDFSQFGM